MPVIAAEIMCTWVESMSNKPFNFSLRFESAAKYIALEGATATKLGPNPPNREPRPSFFQDPLQTWRGPGDTTPLTLAPAMVLS